MDRPLTDAEIFAAECEFCGSEPMGLEPDRVDEMDTLSRIVRGEIANATPMPFFSSDWHDVAIKAVRASDAERFETLRRLMGQGSLYEFEHLAAHRCWGVRLAYASHRLATVWPGSRLLSDDDFRVRAAVWARPDLSNEAREVLAPEFAGGQ